MLRAAYFGFPKVNNIFLIPDFFNELFIYLFTYFFSHHGVSLSLLYSLHGGSLHNGLVSNSRLIVQSFTGKKLHQLLKSLCKLR